MENLTQHIESHIIMSDEELALIQSEFERKSFKKKEYLLQFGRNSNYEYFILKGCVRIFVTDYDGIEHNILFGAEDWWAGDLQSFTQRTSATYSIQALENTIALAITLSNWDSLLDDLPNFVKYSRILLRNAVIAQQNRIVQNLSFTANERYQYFIEHYPNLIHRIAQKHIASYLGITPEFLSMLRNQKKR